MFWVILTSAFALLGGLAGYTIGGNASAFAFTVIGAFVALSARDLSKHRHAILAITVVVFTTVLYFFGLETALVAAMLAFPLQIGLAEFTQRQSPFMPLAAAGTMLTWWLGWHFMGAMDGLIFALLAFLTQVAVHDYFLQTKHAIRRNFPLLGWARYGLELIGDELRQYWFMADTEETPYNRVTRKYVYRSAKGLNNNLGFGTQRRYRDVGEIHMLPSMFPIPDTERVGNRLPPIIIGKNRRTPYVCPWPINISGMSWGALSEEAVRALSSGARVANIHMSTGEGGLTPFHLEGVVQAEGQKGIGYKLMFGLHKLTLGLVSKPVDPLRKLVGGGRIICQIGPAKFGFRKTVTRAVAEQLMGAIYDLTGYAHKKDEEFTMIDMDKVRQVAANDQIVAFEVKLAQGAKPWPGRQVAQGKDHAPAGSVARYSHGSGLLFSQRLG